MAYNEEKLARLKHLKQLAQKAKAESDAVATRVKALEDVGAQANVIESIKVNGTAQAISSKSVNITVPTKVGDLTNDQKFQTETQVSTAISKAVAAADHLKRKVVNSTADIDLKAADASQYIYMVSKGTAGEADKYDEYMVIDGVLEKMGDWGVDLSGYVQKETGKGLSTNDYTTAEKTKLGGIEEGANKYTHPTHTAAASGLYKVTVDAYGHVTEVAPVTKEDITGLGIPGTNTTYSPMSGATSSAAGTNGLVPAPPAGAQGKFLRGDGTWQPLVSYGEATATNAGLMSAADKTKLDGLVLATSAEVKAMLDEVFAEA